MASPTLTCIVLAAGKGSRMQSDRPKVLHELAGRPMVAHVLAAAEHLNPDRRAVVIGPEMDALTSAVAPWPVRVQPTPDGTGGAVRAALDVIAPDGGAGDGDVLVVYGDTPLVTPATFRRMLAARRAEDDPAVVVLGMRPAVAGRYGRLILDASGRLERIVEAADATSDELGVGYCNAGLMVLDGRRAPALLDQLRTDNAKGEVYLTDVVAGARAQGYACATVEAPEAEVLGINSRPELAGAEAVLQERLRHAAMEAGATLRDPSTVYFSADTVIGRDVVIEPFTVFGPGVQVDEGAVIRGFSHLEGCRIRAGAHVGPYARLRPGADVGEDSHVGNFVEMKNARLGTGAKASHLTYLGDATVGAHTNIGAGTITCNYDGYEKHRTTVGEEVFVGSNTALVAPVTVGDRAVIGAGSVVTADVEADALAVARARQHTVPEGGRRYKAKRRKSS